MDDLEFRKFLKKYGITCEEYEGMEEDKKKELESKYNAERMGENLGNMVLGCGLPLVLMPILLAFLIFAIFFLFYFL